MKILVIENREWVRQWISSMLMSYQTVVVHDGLSALQYLSNETDVPDVVILNEQLSDFDGIDLIETILSYQRTSFISMILLSKSDTYYSMEQQAKIYAMLADNELGILMLPYTILTLVPKNDYLINSSFKNASMIC
jgi:CheY-like chemotaxis protein